MTAFAKTIHGNHVSIETVGRGIVLLIQEMPSLRMIAQEGIELENAKDLRKGLDQAICTAEAYVAPEVVILVDWDKVVDGEISDIPLPDEVKVPGSIPQSEVADWLSDNFGFCVKGWTFKES